MPVLTTEIKWMRSAAFNDTAANGGRMSNSVVPSDVRNNILPNVTQAQRTAGLTRYRKLFIKNTNGSLLTAEEAKLFVENYAPGADRVLIFPATQTDIQSGITGSEQLYGCGQLDQDTGTDALSIDVEVEDAADDIFVDGMLIRISDKDEIDGTGNEEYVRLYGDAVYAGNIATLTLDTPLANEYDAVNTLVASVIEAGDIVAVVDPAVVTSTGGTFSDDSDPILPDNVGTIEQNWTLTFNAPTTFAVVGDTVGSVGSGNTGENFEPTNAGANAPYFTIDFAAFGGTFQSGDTITFSTTPAAFPVWYKQVVPAGAASYPNDRVVVGMDYESA